MDTITTDSGRKLKIEEAWVIADTNKVVSAGAGEGKRYFILNHPEVKRVLVLVEVEP